MALKNIHFAGIVALLGMSLSANAAVAANVTGRAELTNLDGKIVGKADFVETAQGVLIEIAAKGLPPGAHAVHVHAIGNCDVKTKFASAGPHFSPVADTQHGYMSEHGAHAGDMPNQVAGNDGIMHSSILNTQISLGDGANTIFDKDGSAFVIHAKADDYKSQPSGDAGDRLVCGVIRKQ